jgi:hypothetical protein
MGKRKRAMGLGRWKKKEEATVMNDCSFCRLILSTVCNAFVAAVLIKVASAYKYVQVFV